MTNEIDDITDEQLENIIERKANHKELIRAIKSLKQDDGLTDLLKKNNDAVSLFISKLKEISKQEAPQVSVTTNNNEVISSIERMAKDILASQKDLKEAIEKSMDKKQTDWTFDVVRNRFGNIQSVTAKTK